MFRLREFLILPEAKSLLIRAAVLAVLMAGILIFAGQIASRAESIADTARQIAETQAKRDAAIALRSQTAKLENYKSKIDQLILNEDEVTSFRNYIRDLASQTGNADLRLTFGGDGKPVPSQRIPNLSVLSFTITMQGTESAFVSFLEKLNSAPHLFRFTSVDIEGSSGIAAFSTIKIAGELFIEPKGQTAQ